MKKLEPLVYEDVVANGLSVDWLNELMTALNASAITVDATSGMEMSSSSGGSVIRYNGTLAGSQLAKNGGSTIGARSGTTPGSGTVTLYQLVGTTLTSTTVTVTAYNLSTTAIAANAYLVLTKVDGKWIAVWEDC